MPLEVGATRPRCDARPTWRRSPAFFDRHNFGPMLRRQAERLALLPLRRGRLTVLLDVVDPACCRGTFTLPPIDSCSIAPELSSLTVKSPLTRAA